MKFAYHRRNESSSVRRSGGWCVVAPDGAEADGGLKGAVESMAKSAKTAKKKTAKKTAKPARKPAAKKAKKKTGGRKPNAAFMAPVTPSAALSEVVGAKPLPRTELTKKLWAYIKKNGLQDAKNKRNINADDKLKPVFGGKKTVSMFEMTKLVSKHLK